MRSNNKEHYSKYQKVKRVLFTAMAFSYSAPILWNRLPSTSEISNYWINSRPKSKLTHTPRHSPFKLTKPLSLENMRKQYTKYGSS